VTQIQSALILAGVGVVLFVYLYNWWLSVRRRREIEKAVAAHSGRAREAAPDPLEPAPPPAAVRAPVPAAAPAARPAERVEPAIADTADDIRDEDEPDADRYEDPRRSLGPSAEAAREPMRVSPPPRAPVGQGPATRVEPSAAEWQVPPPPRREMRAPGPPPGRPASAGLALRPDPADLDTRVDYLMRLLPLEPVPAEDLASMLASAPDLGRRMVVLGCPAGSQDWQAVLRQSSRYEELAFSLQQVDRSGLLERTSLERFANWVDGLAEQLSAACTAPDIDQAHAVAAEFDAFCAEVDVLIGINVVAPDVPVPTTKLRALVESVGFRLQPSGQYTLLDEDGHLLLSLADLAGEPFVAERIRTSATTGVTLLLDIPRTRQPARVFRQMMQIARQVAHGIGGRVVDDQRQNLGDAGMRLISERIAALEDRLAAQQMAPGSALARRVFA